MVLKYCIQHRKQKQTTKLDNASSSFELILMSSLPMQQYEDVAHNRKHYTNMKNSFSKDILVWLWW